MTNKKLYQCPVCGLHYEDEQIAKQCEIFCKEHNGCSLDITQHSVERSGLDTTIDTQPKVAD